MVGIVQKVPSTTSTTQQQTSPQWRAVCRSYGMGYKDLPNQMQGTSLEGAGQERLGLVLYKLIN
jgi:hypothetical protein